MTQTKKSDAAPFRTLMRWMDVYDSTPAEGVELLLMMMDDEGSRYYALAACKDGEVAYQTNNGDVATFDIDAVQGKAHIYYVYLDEIGMPLAGGDGGIDAVAIVAESLGVEPREILGRGRKDEAVDARRVVAMYRRSQGWHLSRIGRELRRTHAAITNLLVTADEMVQYNRQFRTMSERVLELLKSMDVSAATNAHKAQQQCAERHIS